MSKETNKHELLSAYFDGELSPEDRLRAEQLLEESADARRDIDGIAELSELVKSLPTEPAPAELLPTVLRRAERETLLSMNDAPSAASKDRPRSWLTVIGGIAATAAAVLVTVQLLPTMTSSPTESSIADISPDASVVANNQTSRLGDDRLELSEAGASAAAFDDNSSNERVALGAGNRSIAESPAADEPLDARRHSARDLKRAAAARPGAMKPTESLAGRETESAPQRRRNGAVPPVVVREALSLNADALQNARQGDVLQFFSTSGTTVTTYMVTVVDVKHALNQMQLLLARNDIPAHVLEEDEALNEESAAEGKQNIGNKDRPRDANGEANKEAGKQTERLFAVYVETTPDRFTSALKDLLHDKLFAGLYPKPPVDELQIEAADLGQSRRQLFSRLSFAAGNEKKVDAEEQRTGKKAPAPTKTNPARRDAPTRSPQPLLRKSIRLVQTRPANDGTKASPTAIPSNPGQPTDSKAKDIRDKQDERTKSVKRFADAGRGGTPSFQLRVQLAPLPMTADRQKQHASEYRADAAGKLDHIASQTAQDGAFYGKQAKAEIGRAALVRVLFVFREAPKKSTP